MHGKKTFLKILITFIFIFSAISENNRWKAKVIRVIDGDTIDVKFEGRKPDFCDFEERVRLIGINSTEMNFTKRVNPEPYAEAARNFTDLCLYDKEIELSFDSVSEDRKDKYNRILCYVWIQEQLFNEIIVRKGLAYCYDRFLFESSMLRRLKKAEHAAEVEAVGLWSLKNKIRER